MSGETPDQWLREMLEAAAATPVPDAFLTGVAKGLLLAFGHNCEDQGDRERARLLIGEIDRRAAARIVEICEDAERQRLELAEYVGD